MEIFTFPCISCKYICIGMCSIWFKTTYGQTHIIAQKKKHNTGSANTNSVGKSRLWQKEQLQGVIRTIIKTKYASFLAQCREDQWEIGQDMKNVCFCYWQHTLMFLIGLKWMESSRVLEWKCVEEGDRQTGRE